MNYSNDTCGSHGISSTMKSNVFFVSYYIIMPINVCVCSVAYIAQFICFRKQWKEHNAGFGYQMYTAASETCKVISLCLYVLFTNLWSGIDSQGAGWFMREYVLMWYAAHVGVPLLNAFITNSLLLSVSMACDRLFAVGKPYEYRNIRHKRHQIIAFVTCTFISFSTSLFDAFRLDVVGTNNHYRLDFNTDYLNSLTAQVLEQLRNCVRALGLIMLISVNLLVLLLYRRHNRKVSDLNPLEPRVKEQKFRGRTLIFLTASQGVVNSIAVTTIMIFYVAVYAIPDFEKCDANFYSPLLDAVTQINDVMGCYSVFLISKRTRKMIADEVVRHFLTIQRFCSVLVDKARETCGKLMQLLVYDPN